MSLYFLFSHFLHEFAFLGWSGGNAHTLEHAFGMTKGFFANILLHRKSILLSNKVNKLLWQNPAKHKFPLQHKLPLLMKSLRKWPYYLICDRTWYHEKWNRDIYVGLVVPWDLQFCNSWLFTFDTSGSLQGDSLLNHGRLRVIDIEKAFPFYKTKKID